ncbi:hypothetical protein CPB83DRAFT_858505 [Crepidotus variabilis]|uniref:BAG domain-containing protein n=1 Tax=Crepidotus variabilis TaxID=179855 RepID=A0A9P6EBH5_9AGAR|nr:hypothetical protein CPB83DRAFT_858505 [Crepidotus variabilis]
MLHAEEQRQQERARSTSRGRETSAVPINFRQSTNSPSTRSRPSSTAPLQKETPPPTAQPVYNEEHENAASKIQQQYRIHHSYKALDALASQFQTLKSEFVYPRIIDFQQPSSEEGHISVHANRPPSEFDYVPEVETEETPMDVDGGEPKLAYTSVNYPLHTYTDAMDKLLMKLDGVESWGEKAVREKRRSIVRDINKESARLDRYWKQAWTDHIEAQKQEIIPATQPGTDLVDVASEDIQTQLELESDDEPVQVEAHEAKSEDDEWLQVDDHEIKDEEAAEETEVTQNLGLSADVE